MSAASGAAAPRPRLAPTPRSPAQGRAAKGRDPAFLRRWLRATPLGAPGLGAAPRGHLPPPAEHPGEMLFLESVFDEDRERAALGAGTELRPGRLGGDGPRSPRPGQRDAHLPPGGRRRPGAPLRVSGARCAGLRTSSSEPAPDGGWAGRRRGPHPGWDRRPGRHRRLPAVAAGGSRQSVP